MPYGSYDVLYGTSYSWLGDRNGAMLTFNVYDRVLFVRGERYGTAFALDVDRRQYLISARHVVGAGASPTRLAVFLNKQWVELPTTLVGAGRGEIDITVLSPSRRLAEDIPLNPALH